MTNTIQVSKGEITLNGVCGFRIEPTTLRVFDGRGKVAGFRITHSTYGSMDIIGEDRKALLKRLAKEAGSNPDAFAERRFMTVEGYKSLNAALNRSIGLEG